MDPAIAALDLDKLSQIDPEHYPDLRLHIHAACHVVRSRYPVAAIWHAHQPGEAGDFHIDLDSGACRALVSRKNDAVQVSEMNEADALWLSSIRAGNTLGVATDAALEKYPDFDLQAVLLYLLSRDVFADFNLGEIA